MIVNYNKIHIKNDMNEGDKMTLRHLTVFCAVCEESSMTRAAEKLYISAHSAVESQAFYKSLGCVEASEYSPYHVSREPFDCQLELIL